MNHDVPLAVKPLRRLVEPQVSAQQPGLAGLGLLLVPLACCGGPLLITSLAATGALAWGALGLGAGAPLAATVLVILHRRRRRACRRFLPRGGRVLFLAEGDLEP